MKTPEEIAEQLARDEKRLPQIQSQTAIVIVTERINTLRWVLDLDEKFGS